MAEPDLNLPTPDNAATPPADDAQSDSPRRRRARREHEAQEDAPHTAVARADPGRAERTLAIVRECARIADDGRGKDIAILDLRPATSLVDFFLLITANSRRQSNAIAEDIDAAMKKRGELKLGLEGSEEGRWILIDYGDFVVHVFSAEAREYYGLEEIWGDAEPVEWRDGAPPRPATEDPA